MTIIKKIDLKDVVIYVDKKPKKGKGGSYYYVVYAKDIYGFKQIFGRFKNKKEALARAKKLKEKFQTLIRKKGR